MHCRHERRKACERAIRAAELEREYFRLDVGFVDAAVITVCERIELLPE